MPRALKGLGSLLPSKLQLLKFLVLCIVCTPPSVVKAGAGPGFLETPSYTLALLLMFFLVISVAFERSTHMLIHYLKKINRHGLAAAVDNLVTELTLIGLVSLILLVFQDDIHSICVSYDGNSYQDWMLLHNVEGCDCCLAGTTGVGYCFQRARDCGKGFCNCGGHDHCEAEVTTPASEHLRRLLGGGGGGGGESDYYTAVCDGNTALASELSTCSEGKFPAVSLNALHQVHLFLFIVAVGHVLTGISMISIATWRVSIWKKWAAEEDEHSQYVCDVLEKEKSKVGRPMHAAHPSTWSGLLRGLKFHSNAGAAGTPGSSGGSLTASTKQTLISMLMGSRIKLASAQSQASPGSPTAAAAAAAGATGAATATPAAAPAAAPEVAAARAVMKWKSRTASMQSSASGRLQAGSKPAGGTEQEEATPAPSATSLHDAELGGAVAAAEAGSSSPDLKPDKWSDSAGTSPEPKAPDRGRKSVAFSEELDGDEDGSSKSGQTRRKSRLLRRQGSIKTKHGWVAEWFLCFLRQLHPSPVSREEFHIMRASFMLTHRVPESFDFMKYIRESMEDDFAQVVGVSLEMWLTLVIFVLVAGLIGWPALIFLGMAFAIQLIVDTKLVLIIRHVSRRGEASTLASNIFWFKRPPLLLPPIKFVSFLCSFIMSTVIFFGTQFGWNSCPLNSYNGFWFAWPVPWWTSLIFAGAILVNVSFKTLPLYSLTVQMGSDFKHQMLPKGVREKLLRIAQDVKRKRREQVAKDGSVHSTVQHIKRGADKVKKRTAELMQLKSGKEGSKAGAGAPEQEQE